MQDSQNKSTEKRREAHVALGNENQWEFGPPEELRPSYSRQKLRAALQYQLENFAKSVSVGGGTQKDSGPAQKSEQMTQHRI